MITKFELNEKEETEIKEWQDSIKKVYGRGNTGIRVYSHIAKVEKDFTDIDSW
jgi:hypothetical protein